MRTCVGCRVVRPQAELLRTRCPGGRVASALAATVAPVVGRSAYVCPTRECLDTAVRKGGFRRSYRNNAVADADTLWAALSADSNVLAQRKLRSGMHASGRNA